MMQVKTPKVNPVRFFQVGKDQEWTNSLPWWEYKTNYFQKWRETDTLCFQILYDNYPPAQINYKAVNVVTGVIEYEVDFNQIIAGTPYKFGEYFVGQYNQPILGPALWTENKLIQILLTIPSAEGNIYFKSDYQYIYITAHSDEVIDNTILIQAWYDLNDKDFIFTNANSGKPMIRIEGGFPSDGFNPGGKFTVFQDQDYRPEMLSGSIFNTERLVIGTAFGIPNWMVDKINRLITMDNLLVDGVEYVRNEGGKLERVYTDHIYPAAQWMVDLVLAGNPDSDENSYIAGIVPFTADTTLVSADDEEITIDQEYI
jgi:hypothetical protein